MLSSDPKQTHLFSAADDVCVVGKDPRSSGLEGMHDNHLLLYKRKSAFLIEKLAEIGLPAAGQQYRLITRRAFNAIQMLEFICQSEIIIDLKIAIYSINFNAALVLVELVNAGKIRRVEVLMSNLRNHAHREKEQIIKDLFSGHPQFDLFFACSHAKSMSCKTDQDNYYTIEGSGNLAANSRIEQYIIDNDPAIYEFTCRWFEEIKEFIKSNKEFEWCKKP